MNQQRISWLMLKFDFFYFPSLNPAFTTTFIYSEGVKRLFYAHDKIKKLSNMF